MISKTVWQPVQQNDLPQLMDVLSPHGLPQWKQTAAEAAVDSTNVSVLVAIGAIPDHWGQAEHRRNEPRALTVSCQWLVPIWQ